MIPGIGTQTDDHSRVHRLGLILSIAFALLALGLIAGFAGTSVYIKQVKQANQQLDVVTDHRTETHEIISLAMAIDDTANGRTRQELLQRLGQAISNAELTLQVMMQGDQNPPATRWLGLNDGQILATDTDYAALFGEFLQKARAFAAAHQPDSPLANSLSDHHNQISSWAVGSLSAIQSKALGLHQQRARQALESLWLFNGVILITTIVIIAFIATLVLRRLLHSTHRSVKVTGAARNRLAAIIDNIDDGILELTPDGETCFANRSARRILGLRETEAMGLRLNDLLTFAGKDGQAITMALQDHHHASAMAVLLRRPDGSCFRAAVTLTMLSDGERAILTFRDITRHIHREERLRKLSHAVEYSPAQVIITDFTGVIEYVNPSFRTVTGWSPAEVVGRSPRMLSSGSQSPGVYREMWGKLRSGQPWRGEFRNRRKDGSSYWVRASIAPIKDENGAITHFVAVQEDVTKEIQALRELETNRRRLREAVSSLPHGFAIYDADERLSMCNSAYRNMYTNAPESVRIGASFIDILRAGFRSGQFTDSAQDLASVDEEAFIKDRLELFRNGGARELSLARGRWVLATETLTPSGEHVCLRTDITQIKSIQRQLEEARAVADQANTAKSQFLSAMSHELRTPLNAILGFAQLLQMNKKSPLTDRQADQVQQILGAGHHLLTLIDEILDLARIEAGRAVLSREAINAQVILQDCEGLIRLTAEQSGLTMITQTADVRADLLWVQADYTRLKQVLLNLLSNAVKYNSAEGSLWLSARPCNAQECGFDGVEFTVADTGEGIPAHKRDELFKPFNRLGRENSSIQGTGIGLALTHQLILAMDGMLLVEDRPGGGTQFIVRLPAAPAPIISETAPSLPSSPRPLVAGGSFTAAEIPLLRQASRTTDSTSDTTEQQRAAADDGALTGLNTNRLIDWEHLQGRILYIGPDSTRRATLLQTLAGAPEVVTTCCETLEQGLDMVQRLPTNVILIDIPDDAGTDLAGLGDATSHPQWAALPIAALCSTPHPSFQARLRRMGFAAVLSDAPKSVDLYSFLAPLLRLGDQDNVPRPQALGS